MNQKMWLPFLVVLILIGFHRLTDDIGYGQSTEAAEQAKAAIEKLLVKYRRSAAEADGEGFFECHDPSGIFFGTDKKERFTLPELKSTFGPSFEKGIGWKRKVLERHVYVGPNNQIGWFEEKSLRESIPMRTTGVVRKTADGWKIVQYNTSFTIPNELVPELSELILKLQDSISDNDTADSLSAEQRKQYQDAFDYVWKTVRDTYWDKNLGGVDWQAARDELQPTLEASQSASEARQVLSELVSRMEVSHFGIIPKSAYDVVGQSDDEKGSLGGTTGLDVRIVDDNVIVVLVVPESAAARAGIQTGWIIEEFGDEVVAEKLADVKKEFEGNPHSRTILTSAANSRLRGKVGDEITIVFGDKNNKRVTKTLALEPGRGEVVQFGNIPEFRVWVDVRQLDGNVGYFRFNAFMNPVQVMTAYNQFIKDNMDASGIIIDVRGNGGGTGEIGMGMIGWLMEGERAELGKVILRDNELKLIVRPRPTTFQGPVVVLIDEVSVSAAELFACGIKELTNSRLIGTRTAGAVLGSQIERLPTGDGFQYAAANFISVGTGETLEGIGVSPHQVVVPDREMLLNGKDSAIEAALKWIRDQNL